MATSKHAKKSLKSLKENYISKNSNERGKDSRGLLYIVKIQNLSYPFQTVKNTCKMYINCATKN